MISPEQMLEAILPRWRACEDLAETTLLRLSMLRDFSAQLHREKSRCMAKGDKAHASSYQSWEKRLADLRQAADLSFDLSEVMNANLVFKNRTRLLPRPLLNVIPTEKLERYDRAWEFAMAAEAARLGWTFWQLHAAVLISDLEFWQNDLIERLLPNGVLLFTEPSEREYDAVPENAWVGCWTIALRPNLLTPEFRVKQQPGTVVIGKLPEWRILYTASER
jgi:hypothetical protein